MVGLLCVGWGGTVGAAGAEDAAGSLGAYVPEAGGVVGWAVEEDPALEAARGRVVLPEATAGLWVRAMASERGELDRLEAVSAAAEARARGLEALPEELRAGVRDRLETDASPRVVAAAMRTLGVWGMEDAAGTVVARAEAMGDASVTAAADGALMAMGSRAGDRWAVSRLVNGSRGAVDRRSAGGVLLAGEGLTLSSDQQLGVVGVAASGDASASVRVRAAEVAAASGAAVEEGVLKRLAQGGTMDAVVAAYLAAGDGGPAAVGVLRGLLVDRGRDEAVTQAAVSAVVSAGLAKAFDADLEALRDHPSAAARWLAVWVAQAVAGEGGAKRSQRELMVLLDDEDVVVRREARSALAMDVFEASGVVEALEKSSGSWRRLEQLLLLTAALAESTGREDAKPEGALLLRHVEHPRAEVRLAASAALRAWATPESMPGVLEAAKRRVARLSPEADGQPIQGQALVWMDQELGQLFMALGRGRYEPAVSLLEAAMSKKSPLPTASRSAAVWSVGVLREGQSDRGLERTLWSRVRDRGGMEPEADEVRRAAAVSLGRLAGIDAGRLRQEAGADAGSVVGAALEWAAGQHGNTQPAIGVKDQVLNRWFLEAVD